MGSANRKFSDKIREEEVGKVRGFNTQTPSLCSPIRVPLSLTIAAPVKPFHISPLSSDSYSLPNQSTPRRLGRAAVNSSQVSFYFVVSVSLCQEPFYLNILTLS